MRQLVAPLVCIGALACTACLLGACSYEFDEFIRKGGAGGPSDAAIDGDSARGSDCQGVVSQGHCYRLDQTLSLWSSAASRCAAIADFHLVTITSAAEQQAVRALADGGQYWIGLYDVQDAYQHRETSFAWVTAPAEHYDPATSYRNWAAGEPSFVGEYVVMTSAGYWACARRSDAHGAICERDY
jgi:hypothetical protein